MSTVSIETRVFNCKRMSNGRGESNLLMIIEEGVPDVYIGSALIVPTPAGMKDPVQVTAVVDVDGVPIRSNYNTCLVTTYIH